MLLSDAQRAAAEGFQFASNHDAATFWWSPSGQTVVIGPNDQRPTSNPLDYRGFADDTWGLERRLHVLWPLQQAATPAWARIPTILLGSL